METKTPSIFISHSSKDLKVARAARNLLEDRDHHVLLLGLLQDLDDKKIFELLEAEIVAREWLVLVDSLYARSSKWVQFEIECARRHSKTLYTISGQQFIGSTRYEIEESLKPCIEVFSRSLRIFLSYSRRDQFTAALIYRLLASFGYEVFFDITSIPGGTNAWSGVIQKAIDETLADGVFMPVISESSVDSSYVQEEISYAYAQGKGLILPVVIGKVKTEQLPHVLQNNQYFDARHNATEEQWYSLLRMLDDVRGTKISSACGMIQNPSF